VQLPYTKEWVDFTPSNAPAIAKYLAWNADTQTFTARGKDGDSVSAKDDFSVELRVNVKVTHNQTG
jgi:hypothetical protein